MDNVDTKIFNAKNLLIDFIDAFTTKTTRQTIFSVGS